MQLTQDAGINSQGQGEIYYDAGCNPSTSSSWDEQALSDPQPQSEFGTQTQDGEWRVELSVRAEAQEVRKEQEKERLRWEGLLQSQGQPGMQRELLQMTKSAADGTHSKLTDAEEKTR